MQLLPAISYPSKKRVTSQKSLMFMRSSCRLLGVCLFAMQKLLQAVQRACQGKCTHRILKT